MSSSMKWDEAFYSPFSIPIAAVIPIAKFYSHPSDAVDPEPDGWGYPYVDDKGVKIPFGTKSGPRQVRTISKAGVEWYYSTKGTGSEYGNIDWAGKLVNPSVPSDTRRYRLSWNGPQMRYFPDKNYDYSDDRSLELYQKGRILLVAPHPILGASRVKSSYVDPETSTRKYVDYIYVICKDGLEDKVFRYHTSGLGWSRVGLSDDIIDSLRTQYDPDTNPNGFEHVATVPAQNNITTSKGYTDNAREADTPWFFNEAGTKAVCMRPVDRTYTDENSNTYTERALSKYTLDIGLGSQPTYAATGNLDNLKWTETHRYERYLNLGADIWNMYPYPRVSPTYDITTRHPYVRFELEQAMSLRGDQTIACDFDKDLLVEARISVDEVRVNAQVYGQGVDCDEDYLGLPLADNCATDPWNNGEVTGKQAGTEFNRYDGDNVPWQSLTSLHRILFTNAGGDKEFGVLFDGTTDRATADNGTVDPNVAPVIDFHTYLKRFIHFIDLRHPFIVSYTEIHMDGFIDNGSDLSTQIAHKEAYSVDTTDATYIYTKGIVDTTATGAMFGISWVDSDPNTKPVVGGPNWVFSADATYAYTSTNGVQYEYHTEVVSNSWYEGIDFRSGDITSIDPPFVDSYKLITPNKWNSWTTMFDATHYDDILASKLPLNYVVGSMARVGEDWVLSYRRPDTYTGEPTDDIFNIINGADALSNIPKPTSLTPNGLPDGVVALYPLGVI